MPRLALEVQFVLVELSESRNSNQCCTESCTRVVLMIYFRQPLEAMVTTRAALDAAIAVALAAVTASDAAGWFTHAGYLTHQAA